MTKKHNEAITSKATYPFGFTGRDIVLLVTLFSLLTLGLFPARMQTACRQGQANILCSIMETPTMTIAPPSSTSITEPTVKSTPRGLALLPSSIPSLTPTAIPTTATQPTPTATIPNTPSTTPSPTATNTPLPSATPSPSVTPSLTATSTSSPSVTPLSTFTASPTATNTPLPSATSSQTPTKKTPQPLTATNTPVPATATQSATSTPLPTPIPPNTPTPTITPWYTNASVEVMAGGQPCKDEAPDTWSSKDIKLVWRLLPVGISLPSEQNQRFEVVIWEPNRNPLDPTQANTIHGPGAINGPDYAGQYVLNLKLDTTKSSISYQDSGKLYLWGVVLVDPNGKRLKLMTQHDCQIYF